MQLHVPGALEFFKDDLVHPAAGFNQGSGDDGEAATFFDISCGPEEALGFLKGACIDSAGEDASGVGDLGIVGPAEAGERVQEDDDISSVLDHSLGLLDYHLSNLYVPRCRLVKGRADDLSIDRALHVGDFFRALINQQHDQVNLGVVLGDAVGHLLQQDGFTCSRRCYDEPALSFSEGRNEVHDSHLQSIRLELHDQALFGVERGQVVKIRLVLEVLRFFVIERLNSQESKIPLGILRRTN